MDGGGTLVAMFVAQASARARDVAFRSKKGGEWTPSTWADWDRRARAFAAALVEAGVEPGDRVAIFGSTREEWVVADVAALMAGATTVPIYPSLIGEQAAYIVADSGARVLVAEDESFVERIRAHDAAVIARVAKTFTFGALPDDVASADRAKRVDDRIAAVKPDDLAAIIYTSGTTGPPKGVMLTHAGFAFETESLAKVIAMTPDDEQLLFLPMAHIFAKVLVAMQIRIGFRTAFAESMLKALDNAAEVRPTIMGSVPRLYEKVFAVANERAAAAGGLKAKIFRWATADAERGAWGRRWADRLVHSKIRARFGGRLRFAISGGAPLAKELAAWFQRAGIVVLEAYGLTEITGASNINSFEHQKLGTVGRALPGVDVKIAADGEILTRGPNTMRGYWGKESDTREVIDSEGWFHTGDIGEIDDAGFLRITDRKKDIIVTAAGKNIAPQNVENLLKQSPWISQAMVYGDKRPYLVALVTLDAETAARFAKESGKAADVATLAGDDDVRARVQAEIDAVNKRLSSFETVKKFFILAKDFSIEGGELTPTLKVKRKVVSERQRAVIDSMYSG